MNRQLVIITGLYVAQAIPLYLVAAAFPPILRERGADLALIGGFGLLMAPWALKWLWAPVVDRYFTRKTWIVGAQGLTLVLICVISGLDPVEDIRLFFPLLMCMSVSAATQDIAADGYSVEHLPAEAQTRGGGAQGGAVAVGVILGGSLSLFIYDLAGWRACVLSAAALAALSILPFLLADERAGLRPGADRVATRRPSLGAFRARPEMRRLLAFSLLFRAPEGLVKSVEQAFFVDLGFSLTKVGLISGASAALVGIAGSVLGAIAAGRMGLLRFLQCILLLRTLCFAGYALAAAQGAPDEAMIALSALNTFSRYMELVALYAAFLRFSSLDQAGTDFTILASASLLTYSIGSLLGGALASALGYGPLFMLAAALSLTIGLLSLAAAPSFSISESRL